MKRVRKVGISVSLLLAALGAVYFRKLLRSSKTSMEVLRWIVC